MTDYLFSFLKSCPGQRITFKNPVKYYLPGLFREIKVTGLYARKTQIFIEHEDGAMDWNYADEKLKEIIIPLIKDHDQTAGD